MHHSDPLAEIFRLTDSQKTALRKLRIQTVRELLFHFPFRYDVGGDETTIAGLVAGQEASVIGTIEKLKTKKSWKRKIPVSEGYIRDNTGKIKCMWFNQPYIAKMWMEGTTIKATGKVSGSSGKIYLANPHLERASISEGGPLEVSEAKSQKPEARSLFAMYPESRGITSLWFRHAIAKILTTAVEKIEDPIPAELLKKYNLPSLKTALIWIHTPKDIKNAEAARKRFAFEEVFFIQLQRQRERLLQMREKSFTIHPSQESIERFINSFPFNATNAQNKAIGQILSDMQKDSPMSRLLEGDVGSGKTAVAATAAYAVVSTRPQGQDFGTLQIAYMAPTEILARQHFESFIKYFEVNPVNIGLITGSGCLKFPSKARTYTPKKRGQDADVWRKRVTNISRSQLLKWVANGEIPILIGTHALIEKAVRFKHLALVVIDEQHRFGINQRKALVRGHTRGRDADETREKEEPVDPLLYRDLTYRVREAVFKVRKELGNGHKEEIYQRALAEEFTRAKIPFSREERIPVMYQKKLVGTYVPDFVVDQKIVVELKALPFVGPREKKQLWSYLKGSKYRLGLLINFGTTKATIDRVVYDQAHSPHEVGDMSASIPHLLSMTATPIPRTLALTVYGDLDLTLLDEMPVGRKPIITEIVRPEEREHAYRKMYEEMQSGRQAYVICPRIDEPDPEKAFALQAKSVKAEAKRLKKEVFSDCEIGILHSKMKPAEKDGAMRKFAEHEIDILVATSVVEVGVNVPNATLIFIEGAERFGLAQLHQLRGRVVRSTHQSYCFVCPETRGEQTMQRLKALTTAKNGFELAEADLTQRGAGELSGAKQWGISDIGMEALKNLKLVEAARSEALALVEKDESLKHYPLLVKEVSARTKTLHFE